MSNSCTSCNQHIIWDKVAREKLNTKRPLNPDYTIHRCGFLTGGNGSNASKPIAASAKTISPSSQTEDAALKALTQEFKTLLQHITEYLRVAKN
jgi:hypothetical protein